MLNKHHVRRIRWLFHLYDSFFEKEVIYQLSTIWPGCQSSILNDVKISAPINEDTNIVHLSFTAKTDIFLHEHRITSSAAFPPDENMPSIGMNKKAGLVRKKNVPPFVSRSIHMLYYPHFAGPTMPCCHRTVLTERGFS